VPCAAVAPPPQAFVAIDSVTARSSLRESTGTLFKKGLLVEELIDGP